MAIIFLFIDGVGLGGEIEANPFYKNRYPAFRRMTRDQPFSHKAEPVADSEHVFTGIDARLDTEGLPQSGTGQTTLFTGENAAKKVGRHFGPFPHSKIKPLLRGKSLFRKAEQMGKSVVFMNAYPDVFFERAERKNRWSCTTLMTKSAGIPLHTKEDVVQGRALTAELTQETWREVLGIDVPEIKPEEASHRVINMTREKDLILYEYYLTDKAGHEQDHDKAETVIGRFDAFLDALIENKRQEDTIILSSDHGNVEDLSVKTHTLNNVPLYALGPGAGRFREVESIQDVTPAILDIL
ncbi:MAG: alkaline phosphatase family protein [Balneolaceae bacterium]|nr:alkaline phosphatase family protein [Balneolaceae bacterium]